MASALFLARSFFAAGFLDDLDFFLGGSLGSASPSGRRDDRFDHAEAVDRRSARVAQHEDRERVAESLILTIVVPEHDVDVFIVPERRGQLLITSR